MESSDVILYNIFAFVLIFGLPVLAVLIYRLVKNKIYSKKNKDYSHSVTQGNGSSEKLGHNNSEIKPLVKEAFKIDSKYYKWLISSIIGSFLLFGGFIYGKGNGLALLILIVTEWLLASLVNGLVWSLIVAGITGSMKRNYKNAFLGTFAICVFASACAVIARTTIALK
jgi:hypothetical protein